MTEKLSKLMQDFRTHVQALSRFIYVVTEEEDTFISKVRKLLKDHEDQTKVYNPTCGWVEIARYMDEWKTGKLTEGETTQINPALIQALKDDPEEKVSFYIILDPERFLKEPHVQRRYLNLAHQLHNNDRMIKIFIFVSSTLFIPPKLQRYVSVIHDQGLEDEEIQEHLEYLGERLQINIDPGLVRHFRGLTNFQIDAAVAQSVIKTKYDKSNPKRIEPKVVGEYKRNQLNKSSLVSFLDVREGFESIGGLDRFKKWAEETKPCWTKEGQVFGLRPPRGVLTVGVYGCGKSIATKALGKIWRLPVVELDMGRLRSSGVGDTEANVYRMINLVESVAPCVLWTDEAEKNFAGTESSSQSDAGTTSRMLGIFSTWLQETDAQICLAMTANKIKGLPSELLNRADERFFFDLPAQLERVDILKIHLQKVGRDPTKFPLADLAQEASDLVGREIEQAIGAALRTSFAKECEDLDPDILAEALRSKPRILRTAVEDLNDIIEWAGYDPTVDDGVRARLASSEKSEAFSNIIKLI